MDVLTYHFVCEESAFGSLESLIEQGLEEDAVLEGQRDEKVSQIVDELQGVRYSMRVIRGLSDALNEYKVNGDIATFVENVREVNDKIALGHPMIESKLNLYAEDGDAEWFAEKIEEIVGDFDGGYAPYTAGGVSYSNLTDIPAYQASAELSVRLDSYKAKQITLSELVESARAISQKYVKTGQIETAVEEYDNGAVNEDEFIYALEGFISIYPPKVLQDFSKEKQTIEETFGGIWIEDSAEFAKFVSAVNTYPKDRDGEGIAFTDNFFYAYYLNTSNDAIPYAEVDLNGIDSQKYVDKIIKYGENRTAREWVNWFNENIRNGQYKNNGINIGNQTASTARADGRVDSKLPRLGRYYYNPELYSEVERTDSGSTGRGGVRNSLITPEMDAAYLDAVNNGDMETAQQMVMEAAKRAGYTEEESADPDPSKVFYDGNFNNVIWLPEWVAILLCYCCRGLLLQRHLVEATLVTATLVLCLEPDVEHLQSLVVRDETSRHTENI